jgi:hypothetical protein
MNEAQLCEQLKASKDELALWVSQGLPRTKAGKAWSYDEKEVGRWIRAQVQKRREALRAQQPVARTFGEAVRMLAEQGIEVGERTLHTWSKKYGDFPAMAGTRGQANGSFPILDLKNWILGNAALLGEGGGGLTSGPRCRIETARATLIEMEIEEKRGNLVPREEAVAFVLRANGLLLTMFEGWVEQMAATLPIDQQPAFRELGAKLLDLGRESVADQLSQEEITQEGEPSSQAKSAQERSDSSG